MAEVSIDELVWRPLYTFTDADYLAGVSKGTSKRWLTGYSYKRDGTRRQQPPVTKRESVSAAVSFGDLVEIVAIGRLKANGFPLRQVREIVKNCQDFFKQERPLVTLQFKISGRSIFVPDDGANGDGREFLTEVGKYRGKRAWQDILQPFLEDLDYSDYLATKWWPLGRQNPVVIDPRYAYGFPVIDKSGIRTEIILERFRAGELHEEIADDFNIAPLDVERALQFELQRIAA